VGPTGPAEAPTSVIGTHDLVPLVSDRSIESGSDGTPKSGSASESSKKLYLSPETSDGGVFFTLPDNILLI
jgi:hypothetical protein